MKKYDMTFTNLWHLFLSKRQEHRNSAAQSAPEKLRNFIVVQNNPN